MKSTWCFCVWRKIKNKILNVPVDILEKHGAVSKSVAKAMASGVKNAFKSDWSIAISGIAGPSGETKNKPIGLVNLQSG